jgi:hypothetical protein
MNSYILLRDNKESGSLSLEDLQQIGLKATDLIWVECQSVGWRNPHEIKELKDLLDPSKVIPVIPKPAETGTPTLPEAAEETSAVHALKKNLVYVELPAKLNGKKQTEQQQPVIKEELPADYKYAGLATAINNSDPGKTLTPGKTDPVVTKYSRPLDEIKEMYVKNMQEQVSRKKTVMTIPAIRISKELKKVFLYSGLFLSGALLMFLFRGNKGKAPVLVSQHPTTASAVPVNKDTLNTDPFPAGSKMPVEETAIPVSTISPPQVPEKKQDVPGKNSLPEKNTGAEEQDPDNSKEVTGKTKTAAEETNAGKPVSAEGLSSQLSLRANDFSIGSFGGIKNLEMTLQNDSKYLLDKVVVEIRYLNPEGMTIITDDIHFKSVYPGAAETVAVKKSRRGVKIAYKITRIESKEIGGSTTGL